MSAPLMVDEDNRIKEARERIPQPKPIRLLAGFFSYLLHPLFIPVYVTYFLVNVQTYLFAGFDNWMQLTTILRIFVNCTFLPVVSILLLKGLKLIHSVHLPTQRDRIIPYVIVMIFYFWNWYTFKGTYAPKPLVAFSLAAFICTIIGFMANIFMKISMHTLAAGAMVTFIAILALTDGSNFTTYMSYALLATGLIASSRLIASDHFPGEVYWGLLGGAFAQLIAWWLT